MNVLIFIYHEINYITTILINFISLLCMYISIKSNSEKNELLYIEYKCFKIITNGFIVNYNKPNHAIVFTPENVICKVKFFKCPVV